MTDEQYWHELFPPREDEPSNASPPQISVIFVRKMQPTNKYDTHPLGFSPNELKGFAEVYAAWGGGQYEFIGRNEQRQIVRRHTERIGGAPKPWPGIIEDNGPETSPASAVPPSVTTAPPSGTGWLAVAGVLGPLALEYLKFQAQAAATQQQQFQFMMTTLLDRGSAAGKEHLQAMAQMYSSMPEMFAKVMSQGAGGGSSEAFLKGLETAKELYEGMREAQGEGDLDTNSLMQAAAGFMQFINQQGGPMPGGGMPGFPDMPGSPPPGPPPPPTDPPDEPN